MRRYDYFISLHVQLRFTGVLRSTMVSNASLRNKAAPFRVTGADMSSNTVSQAYADTIDAREREEGFMHIMFLIAAETAAYIPSSSNTISLRSPSMQKERKYTAW